MGFTHEYFFTRSIGMKRIIGMIALIFTAGALLFAGGGSDGGAIGGQKAAVLRFSWWGSDPRHQATLAAMDRYHEIHPEITIEGEYQGYDGYFQKLLTQIAGRTEPDLIQIDYNWLPELAVRGNIFADLGSLGSIDLSSYPKTILDNYCNIGGKVIGLPMGTNGYGIMINKVFYRKHNIPVDTEWTWESMIETGGRIHRSNPNDYLLGLESSSLGGFIFTSYIYSKTGKYWVDDNSNRINVSRSDLAGAFTIMKQIFDSGVAQPLGEASLFMAQMEQNPKWINGELGFTFDWSSTVGKFKNALKEGDFTVGKPAFAANGANKLISIKPSMELGISGRSSHVGVAADFANWLLTDREAVLLLGTQRSVPTNQNAIDILNNAGSIDPDVAAMVAFTLAAPAGKPPILQDNGEVGDLVRDICEQVVFGRLSPEAAADKFLSDVQAKFDSLKASR
jgi:oligogalacturonide transport system substrate-binding protein